jgi:hypothetical protein
MRRRVEPELLSRGNPVTFWSNLEPASDDTSMRNSEPMYMSQSAQAPASAVPTGRFTSRYTGTPQAVTTGVDVGPVAASNAHPPEPDEPSVSIAISQ